MWFIKQQPNPSGAYSSPQSKQFKGSAELTDDQLQIFHEYNGFVTLTIVNDVVIEIVPNTSAWEEWKLSQPDNSEEEPPSRKSHSVIRDDTDSMLIDYEYRLTLLELGVSE